MPQVKAGQVLIKTHRSLVSLGTERMLVGFGQSNLIEKARQQPDKVKQVLTKVKSDGLMPTINAVRNKLDDPIPLGYCNAGEVIAVGKGVTEFKVGDRVVSNGRHAEVVSVPKNLVVRIPDGVSYEEATFTVISSIGLQGIRLIDPTFGETIVVTGLGLIGLLSGQLLRANGCRVIGLDIDERKIQLARELGMEAINVSKNDPVEAITQMTDGIGADGVLITASAKSQEIISQAAQMSRKRGRIVLVGVIGLNIMRSDFYEKELSFQVSCSYGPGRYDEDYEGRGQDYPLPFVRWTENRNFQAILAAIRQGSLQVKPLISEILDFEDYNKIYANISTTDSIATILKYSGEVNTDRNVVLQPERSFAGKKGTIAVIGAGNFTKMNMMPKLSKLKADVKYIASAGGLSATMLAKKYGIANSVTDLDLMLQDPEVEAVLITTRHNAHAWMVEKVLAAGKHAFVEKPLAIDMDGLNSIRAAYAKSDKSVMVGFNRRFSPFIQKAKSLIGSQTAGMNVIATMNAGFIPADSWVHDLAVGGGRIIGEACHLIDAITFLVGDQIESVYMSAAGTNPTDDTDNAIITLKYRNGAQGVVNYFANGHKSYSKERFEIYNMQKMLVLDNFRKMRGYGFRSFSQMSKNQDKGHLDQFKRYIDFLKTGGEPLISFAEIENTTLATFAALESMRRNQVVHLSELEGTHASLTE